MILDNPDFQCTKIHRKGYIRIRTEWVTENGIRYAQLSVEDTGYTASDKTHWLTYFNAIIRKAESIRLLEQASDWHW